MGGVRVNLNLGPPLNEGSFHFRCCGRRLFPNMSPPGSNGGTSREGLPAQHPPPLFSSSAAHRLSVVSLSRFFARERRKGHALRYVTRESRYAHITPAA